MGYSWSRGLFCCSFLYSSIPALINALLDGISVHTWIGMKRADYSMKQWVDNSPISYENWARGQPNGYVSGKFKPD